MQMIRLGKSELEITKVGFGGIPIQRLSEADAIEVMREAMELGINWFDTAYGYGSEVRIGKVVKSRSRDSIKIFTKGPGKTAEELVGQVETSLERMQLDYIDLYQFHGVSRMEDWEEMRSNGTVEMLAEMKNKGAVRHIGVSCHSTETALKMVEQPEIEVIQVPFNFIVEEDGLKVLAKCKEYDIGFISMKPFGGGELEDAGICIRFQMEYPEVVADPGFERIEEVRQVIELVKAGKGLTQEDKAVIERLRKDLGKSFCRRCGYCLPCKKEINIPVLMTMESLIKRLPKEKILSGWVAEAGQNYENCIECGECEERCPYRLSTMGRIKKGGQVWKEFVRTHKKGSVKLTV